MIFENHIQATPAKRGAINRGTGIFLIIAHLAAVAALFFWSWPAVITALVLYWVGGSLVRRGVAANATRLTFGL